jgi:hypothetical protein
MKKHVCLMSLLMVVFPAVSAVAHHSYGEYDRDKMVTLEGAVKTVSWANPHVLITLQTDNQGDYTVEWNALVQLYRQGLKPGTVKSGDRLAITGSINRNPEKRILALVREIRRPADGWNWTNGWSAPVK